MTSFGEVFAIPDGCGFACYTRGLVTVTSSGSDLSLSSAAAATNSITGRFDSIDQRYQIDHQRVIGSGYHATVKECINRYNGRRFAVKSIRKWDPAVKQTNLHREVKLLREMSHDNIVHLVDVFEDSEYLHIVTDLYHGGELFHKIDSRVKSSDSGCFAEDEAASILHQVLNALAYLHRHDIVHRDIKPENIMFETTKEDSPIKIIDFGLARKHYEDSFDPFMSSIVGTPYFLAPEVLQRKYDKRCDLWSIGVIAFILLGGYRPFNGSNDKEVGDAVRRGKFYFRPKYWRGVSDGAKDFVTRLLQVDPGRRMTVEQALNHPWMVKHTGSTLKDETCRSGPCVEVNSKNLRRRNPHRSVRDCCKHQKGR